MSTVAELVIETPLRLGEADTLPELINRLAGAENTLGILCNADLPEHLESVIYRAQNDAIDLRRMLTHRLQQLEVLEAFSSTHRAFLYWSSISRLWVAEVEPWTANRSAQ